MSVELAMVLSVLMAFGIAFGFLIRAMLEIAEVGRCAVQAYRERTDVMKIEAAHRRPRGDE